jgi:4-amino-4-deoxy-L-arabinose transferase-like glycosyltransferase
MAISFSSIGSFIDRRHRLLVLALFICAFALLFINAATKPFEHGGPDGLKYERFGFEASESGNIFKCGNFGHAYWSPGWITTIAVIYRIIGRQYMAIRVFLILTALATAFLVYRTAYRLAGRRAAVVAPALFLYSSLVFRFTCFYQYELPLAFLTFSSFAVLFVFNGKVAGMVETGESFSLGTVWRTIGAGILIGLAAMYSPRVLIAIVVSGFCFYARGRLLYLARALPVFIVGIFLVLAPWGVRNYRCFGEPIFTTSNGGINLYIGNNPDATGGYYLPPPEARPQHKNHESGKWFSEALRYMYRYPVRTLKRSMIKGLAFWNPHYGDQVIVLLAFIAGLIRMKRGRVRFSQYGILWIVLLPFSLMLVHMIFFVQPRYILPVLPSLAVIGGIGLGGIGAEGMLFPAGHEK